MHIFIHIYIHTYMSLALSLPTPSLSFSRSLCRSPSRFLSIFLSLLSCLDDNLYRHDPALALTIYRTPARLVASPPAHTSYRTHLCELATLIASCKLARLIAS